MQPNLSSIEQRLQDLSDKVSYTEDALRDIREDIQLIQRSLSSLERVPKEESLSSLERVPHEILLVIFSYTGECISDLDEDIKNPFRRDILQLYCCSKNFSWLKDLWITGLERGEYIDYFVTYNIFGVTLGPMYMFYDGLYGYKFVQDDSILGSHFYTIMPYSNLGFFVANGEVYDMISSNNAKEIVEQVLPQWKEGDPESYDWCHQRIKDQGKNLLVRQRAENYPEYKFSIPEHYKVEEEFRREKWTPKWEKR